MNIGAYELNRTYCGNNAELIAGLPDACIDLTVTSPPYDDMDLDFNPLPKSGLRTYNGYTWDFKTLARELYRVTKPGGVCVWVVNDPTIDGSESLASSLQKIYFRRVGWNIHDTMIYNKGANPTHDPRNKRYKQNHEYAFILSKGAPVTYNEICDVPVKEPGKRFNATTHRKPDGDMRIYPEFFSKKIQARGTIWSYTPGYMKSTTDKMAFDHDAIFPEALARDHITSWSNPGDVILDPFHGSGTVGKMATEAGRNFIGFEISQEYTALCNRRTAGAKVPLFDWTATNAAP